MICGNVRLDLSRESTDRLGAGGVLRLDVGGDLLDNSGNGFFAGLDSFRGLFLSLESVASNRFQESDVFGLLSVDILYLRAELFRFRGELLF